MPCKPSKSPTAAAAAERYNLKRGAAVVGDVHRAVPHARFAGTHKSAFAQEFDASIGEDALERIAAHVGNVEGAGRIDAHAVRRDGRAARVEDLLALHDTAIGAGREFPDASVAIVSGVDESLGVDGDTVEAAADLRIARDVGEHALRIGGRVAYLHVAVRCREHVEAAGGRPVSALDAVKERLREVKPAVEVLDAVCVVEPVRNDLALVDPVVLEGDAKETSLGVLLVVADIEFTVRPKADAHGRGVAALLAGWHVEPLDGRSARLVEAEHRAGLSTVVVRRGNHEPSLGIDAHSVGRGACGRHLNRLSVGGRRHKTRYCDKAAAEPGSDIGTVHFFHSFIVQFFSIKVNYIAAARAAANSEHFTSAAPSIWRAKS